MLGAGTLFRIGSYRPVIPLGVTCMQALKLDEKTNYTKCVCEHMICGKL